MRSDLLLIPRFSFKQNFRKGRFPSNGEPRKLFIRCALRNVGEISEGGTIRFKLVKKESEPDGDLPFTWGYVVSDTHCFKSAKTYIKEKNNYLYLALEDELFYEPYEESPITKRRKKRGYR